MERSQAYCVLALGRCDAVRSKKALALAGVLSCVLSCAAAIGFCALVLGVPQTPVTKVVFFLAIGIGVDDMFVIAHAFDEVTAADPRAPLAERAARALARAGATVLMTSVTDFVAFLCSAASKLPAIRANLAEWIEQVRLFSSKRSKPYKSIDAAAQRMLDANSFLSPEQARHLTVHGVARNEDGTFSWKFFYILIKSFFPHGIKDKNFYDRIVQWGSLSLVFQHGLSQLLCLCVG